MPSPQRVQPGGGGDPRGVDAGLGVHGYDDLEVALELRLGAARPDDHPGAVGEPVAQPVGGRQVGAAEREVVDPLDRETAELGRAGPRAAAPSRRRSATGRRPAPTPGRWRAGRAASARSSRTSTRVAAGRLGLGRELAEQQQRRDAVLVLHVLGVDAVAERLLVAEGEPVDPADPLEAGERLDVRLAGGRRHLPEQARGDDRRRRRCRCVPRGQQVRARAARRPRRRAASASRARSGTAAAHRSASGSLATTRSAPCVGGERHREVHRARLLRVGERDGREVRVGLLLLLDHRAAR